MRGKILRGAGKTLLWILVFAVLAMPAVFMNTVFGYLTSMFMAVLLIGSLSCLSYLRRHIQVETDMGDVRCERGKSVAVGLKLANHSRIFCPKANANLYINDLFGLNDSVKKIHFTIAGKETLDFGFGMAMDHIGVYSIGLKQIDIYDFFSALHRRVPAEGNFTANVTPIIRPLDELHVIDLLKTEASRDTRITVVGGYDYTGVREYSLGDPMKQIHWKLSAHTRQYMTKLQESNRRQEFVVILDFAAEPMGNREALMDLNDCLIETALSIVDEVSRRDTEYALLYCARSGGVERVVPKGRENDLEMIQSFAMITTNPGETFYDGAQILENEGRMHNRGSNVIVVTSRITPELVQELMQVRGQRRNAELYAVVHASLNSRELEEMAAPLKPLEDVRIPYYFISTEVNQGAQSAG